MLLDVKSLMGSCNRIEGAIQDLDVIISHRSAIISHRILKQECSRLFWKDLALSGWLWKVVDSVI